jgi:hypothetical protein
MKTNDITKAKNPAMRGALNALIRAAAAARKIAIQTNTHLVIFKDGKIQRISPEELRLQAETNDAVRSIKEEV